MNPSFIVNLVLEKISTKWDAHPLTSLSNQDVFLKNLNANCNTNFFTSFFNVLINKINWYLLTCAINATCKNRIPWLITTSCLISQFQISGRKSETLGRGSWYPAEGLSLDLRTSLQILGRRSWNQISGRGFHQI